MFGAVGREVVQKEQAEKRIRIFFGTETGTAEEFATVLEQKLKEHFDVSVDMMVCTRLHTIPQLCT